ncbi:MAG: Membrane protein insertase YidC, partial [Pseudomonadota bacterium]
MVQRRTRSGARTSTQVAFAFIASPVNSLLFEEVFMNDIRRTFLWVIFGFSMVLLWDQWQVYNGNKATFFPAPTAAPADKATAAATPSAAKDLPVASTTLATPNMAAGPSQVPVSANAPVATPLERIDVSTDVLKLSFDTEGGSLVRSEFLKFGELADNQKPFVLLDDSKSRVYLAQTGLIGGPFASHKTPMKFTGERELKAGQNELILTFESAETGGLKLVKTYTLTRGSYALKVSHKVVNTGAAPAAPQLYVQLVRDGNKPEGESSFYMTFTGPAVYTDAKKFQKLEFSDIEKGKADFEKTTQQGYVAMVQHYFASAWLLPENTSRENFARKVDTNLYAVGMITPFNELAPGQSKTMDVTLFVGPQEEKILEALAPGLELVKDYGWLTVLAKPLYWLLDRLFGFLQNWGWAIVALVFLLKLAFYWLNANLLKLAFYWLNAKAYASMAKMKAINPKIMEMRERLKDNPQQMQQEMMRIYREEKVNPMGGCFPIMVQIPVFIALYWVLLSSVEMRNAPWVGWIHDLSAPDPYFILPVVMTLSTMLQTALNPAPPDPMQAKLMWIMPLVFSVMFFFFPAGLVLYW